MADRSALSEFASRSRRRAGSALARRFGIDTRALAAFRISLALILLVDLAHRSGDLVAFYTDRGVLPRTLLAEQSPTAARLSLHAVSGAAWAQAALFLLAAAVALALLVGYRTRLATLCSLVLLLSLHARNPLILNGADGVLRLLLGLGVLLPLGERWSIDAIGRSEDRRRVSNLATAAILLQIVAIFVTNAVIKLRGERWPAGEGAVYAFGLDQYTILLGNWLAGQPALLELLNWGWLGLLAASPLLVVLTGRARVALVAAFVGGQLGLALSMSVGLFPAVLSAGVLLFLPPRSWDAIERTVPSGPERVDRWRERLAERRRSGERGSGRRIPLAIRQWHQLLAPVLVGALLLVLLAWNAGTLGYVDPPEPVDSVDPEEHRWGMFAPDPAGSYGWYVVPAELNDGSEIDAFQRAELTTDRPPDAARLYPNFRWRSYTTSLHGSDENAQAFGASLCDRADERHGAAIERLRIVYLELPVGADDRAEPSETELARYTCAAAR